MKPKTLAAIYLNLFTALILLGIAVKRVWGHPEFMMLFHLPAAVFLVLGGIELKKNRQSSYDAEVEAVRRREAHFLPERGSSDPQESEQVSG